MNPWFQKIFVAYVFVFGFFLASRPLSDGDFWWHLKTGEYIVKNLSIPRTDSYSFTNFGKAWVAHEWLSDVFFYLVYSWFGFNVLIAIFSIITIVAFWFVFRRSHAHPFIAGTAVLLGIWTVLPTIGVRPRVFTLLLASVYLAILQLYTERNNRRVVWFLVPLMALWVNLHAGYVIGLVLIGLAVAGMVLDLWAAGQPLKSAWPKLKYLGLVFCITLLAVNLNPQGPRIYLFPFEFFLSPVQQRQITDWFSPNFHEPDALPLAILILGTVAVTALSPKRVKTSELLFLIPTLYATLKSSRHLAIFALIATPLLATYGQQWLGYTRLGKRVTGQSSSRGSRVPALLLAVGLLIPLAALIGPLRANIFSQSNEKFMRVPVRAVEHMKRNQITGNTFTDPNIWGGYLIWQMPSNPVYVDGRIDMYGDDFVRDYLNITWGVLDWKERFNRYGVNVALLSPRSVLKLQLRNSPDWEQVYEDDMAVVLVKRSRDH